MIGVMLALTTAAAAETRPSYGGNAVASLSSEPTTIDPTLARTHAELTLVGLVFDTLYRATPDGALSPHLALALPVVTGATIRIRIRSGVEFHDGSTLSPDDVVASLERLRKSAVGDLLAGISAVTRDGDSIVLTAVASRPDLGEIATMLSMAATAVTRGGTAPTEKRAIGTGPFVVDAIDHARRRATLHAMEHHFAGRPYLDTLELTWFLTADAEARRYEVGSAQVSARGATAFVGHDPKYRTVESEGAATLCSFVGFGRAQAAITGDRGFRRALSLAIARSAFTGLGSGERITASESPIPTDLGGPPASTIANTEELDAARVLLDDAGGRVPALTTARRASLRLAILVDATRLDDREIAERVSRALDKLGVGSTIEAVDAAAFRSRVGSGKADLYIDELAMATTRPTVAWTLAFDAGGDDWARDRLRKGALDVGAAERAFTERAPIVPLLHRAVRYQIRSDLRGSSVDLAGRLGYADLFYFGAPQKSSKAAP